MNNKIYKKLFVGFGFVIIVLILTLFVMSQTYIQNLVYHERLSQMEEVTHQMFHSLEDVIDTHWDEVDVQCNYLYNSPLETDTDLYRYLKKLSELSNYHEKQIDLIAVDSAGHYYTALGRTGLLRGITYLESAPERVSYVSNSLTVDDSRMVFLKQLPTPITLQSETGEITLRYFGISQSMTQLNDYFHCDAYENNNSVYVLDNNGFKLFNANDTELLKGHNVYTVLSQMSYLHGSSFAAAKERLARTGSCYSNAVLDGTEYYYALKQMENAQWTLAFLVPAEYVAVNTQKLVNIVMVVIVGFATVFSIMAVIAGWFLLREKQQRELRAEKETNLRLEQYNIQLTQANDEMRRAQDAAAEALQSAERASKAKTDFLSNMSHDIRTPMNAIIGITTLMKNELHEPEKLAEHLGKLESSGQLLLGIINNILDMSRIESGKTTLNVEKMNLPQQISQLDSIIRQQAGQRQQVPHGPLHLEEGQGPVMGQVPAGEEVVEPQLPAPPQGGGTGRGKQDHPGQHRQGRQHGVFLLKRPPQQTAKQGHQPRPEQTERHPGGAALPEGEGRKKQAYRSSPYGKDGAPLGRDDQCGAAQFPFGHLPLRPQASVSRWRVSSCVSSRMRSHGSRTVLPWGMMSSVSRVTLTKMALPGMGMSIMALPAKAKFSGSRISFKLAVPPPSESS